jgi:integrase
MRLEEICQLHIKDIYIKDNIWIIDLNEIGIDEKGFSKTLKNKSARRIVPIHQELINIGLINYYEYIKGNNIRLFPELSKTDKTGKYGKQPGKQFSELVKKTLNIEGH